MSESNGRNKSALHIYTKDGLPLTGALLACQKILNEETPSAVAMVYATDRCRFARLQTGGQLLDENEQPLNLSSVYEARVFNGKAELRWRHTGSGKGDASLLTEEKQAPQDWGLEEQTPVSGTIEQKYLLWGESLTGGSKPGWIKMATPRIGRYFVPVKQERVEQVRVQLNALEYLRQDETHGNVFVFEERWLNLTTVAAREGERKEANNG